MPSAIYSPNCIFQQNGFSAALPIQCTHTQLQSAISSLVFIFPHDLIFHILIPSLLAATGAFPVTPAEAGPGGPAGEEALQRRVMFYSTVFPHSQDAHEFQGEHLNYISILLFSLQLLTTEL